MKSIKYTRTATFLFPLLEIPKTIFSCNIKTIFGSTKFTTRLLNVYMQDSQINNYKKDHLFVVVRNFRDVAFDAFYTKLINFPNYVEDYESHDCLIVVFSISTELKKDYDLLLKGKYSEISEYSKNLIIQNNYYNGDKNLPKAVLNKSIDLKEGWEEELTVTYPVDLGDQEVWSIINLEEEILYSSVLKNFSKNDKLQYKGEF